jgi:hypothetical protein
VLAGWGPVGVAQGVVAEVLGLLLGIQCLRSRPNRSSMIGTSVSTKGTWIQPVIAAAETRSKIRRGRTPDLEPV